MVHRREIDGAEIVLGNQGALWGNAMTWFDHDTGSVWSQPLGEAVAGPRKGERLEILPVSLTDWASWLDRHPDTLALDAPGVSSGGFRLEDMTIVLELSDDAAAYRVRDVREVGVVNDEVDGVPIAVTFDPTDDQRWAVYSRVLDDVVVDLAVDEDLFVDVVSGSRFDPAIGRAVDGPLEGQILDLLPGFTAFPRDFSTFWPDGRLWEPAG
jgi:hypothetical protein